MKQVILLSVLSIVYVAYGYDWLTYVQDGLSVYGIKQKMVDEMAEGCRNETDVDTDLFYNMSQRDFPEDRKLKCFWSCLATKLGVIMAEKNSSYLNPDALADKLTQTELEVATDCLNEHVTGKGDKCDEIYAAHVCYMLTRDKIKKCNDEQTSTTEEAAVTTEETTEEEAI